MTSPAARSRLSLLAALLATAGLLAACGGSGDDTGDDAGGPTTTGVAPEGIEGVVAFDLSDNSHVEGNLDYPTSPPVGGPHNPVWANCGTYDEPVPDENAVHSLEHGAVWIAYAEDLDAAQVEALAARADAADHVLVAPYPGLAGPVVLTAWNRQLAVDSADDPRIDAFVETYVDGPTAPETSAPCSGGAG